MKRYCPRCSSSKIKIKKGDVTYGGKKRWQCKDCNHRTVNPFYNKPETQDGISLDDIQTQTYVITSAMANTDTDYETLAVLENYCNFNDAQLLVCPVKYRNKDNINMHDNEPLIYDRRLEHMLLTKNYAINSNLTIFAERSINATRKVPLMGKEIMTGERSGIFAHPSLNLDMVATTRNNIPKIMTTTCSVSVPNYSDSDMGGDAHINHTLGAVVVEVDGDEFHIRHIMVKNGETYDLDKRYTVDNVFPARPSNIVLGDLHESRMTEKEKRALVGKNGIVTKLNPELVVIHDAFDFHAENHHHKGDALLKYMKAKSGEVDIKKELDSLVKFLKQFKKALIVPSNHNDHLTQWLNKVMDKGMSAAESILNVNIKNTLEKMALDYIDNTGRYPNVLDLYLKKKCKNLIFADRNDRYVDVATDLANHGDKGSNGSRGNRRAYLKTGVQTTIGHGHSPFWVNGWGGVIGVGVSAIERMYYAVGLSSWMYAHSIEFENGQRQLIMVINRRWRPKSRM